MDIRLAAKYPFLKDASKILREKDITLENLISGVAYERARLRGKERVMEAIEDGTIEDRPTASESDASVELLSYPVARMIISAVADPMMIRRYAIAESKKASERLRKEELPFIKSVAEEMGLSVHVEDGTIAIDFTDFLRFSAALRDRRWKLVNQDVVNGKVLVTQRKLARLVEQMLADRIASELPLPVNDDIINAFSADVEEIRRLIEERRAEQKGGEFGKISIVRFPPCMKKMLDMIRAGENVPHSGRFALVAFLHTLGMDSQEIMDTFASAPDFDQSKTRYQVEHITGEISGTEYTPPECSTMKSYGICFDPDELCKLEWMTHPLKYYRAKGRRHRSRK